METTRIAKQMVTLYRTVFNNTYNTMVMCQDQLEKSADVAMQQMTWMPEEGMKTAREWAESYRKGREEFKTIIDANFGKVEEFFAKTE